MRSVRTQYDQEEASRMRRERTQHHQEEDQEQLELIATAQVLPQECLVMEAPLPRGPVRLRMFSAR